MEFKYSKNLIFKIIKLKLTLALGTDLLSFFLNCAPLQFFDL